MDKKKIEEAEAMRDTLIVFGPKSEGYYKMLSIRHVIDEYDRFMKGARTDAKR